MDLEVQQNSFSKYRWPHEVKRASTLPLDWFPRWLIIDKQNTVLLVVVCHMGHISIPTSFRVLLVCHSSSWFLAIPSFPHWQWSIHPSFPEKHKYSRLSSSGFRMFIVAREPLIRNNPSVSIISANWEWIMISQFIPTWWNVDMPS